MSEQEPKPAEPQPAALPSEAPQWATDLITAMRDLPGKLAVTLRDDDVNKLAEGVHGFFERAGAFEKPAEEPPTTEPPTAPQPSDDVTPEPRQSTLRTFAKRFE